VPDNPDDGPRPKSTGDRIVFVEQGIEHSFQHEGAKPAADRQHPFLRLNFVSVYVNDQECSKRFFVDQLGFDAVIDVRFPSGYHWIEVAPPDGSARLALVRPAPGFAERGLPGQSSLITFMTEDVEAKYREWSQRGVKFSLPPHTPEWGGLFCRFEDVDGNPFGIASFDDVAKAIETRRRAEEKHREAERLAAQELEIAKQVQGRLLPQRLPSIPTLDCAGICVQARAVGGDYFDFLELGRNRVAIIVSDIAGKGIAASLLMATLRSQCAWAADHPEQALALVNRMLFENTQPQAYATLFYAEYDTTSGRLRYANCGHLPGLLLHEEKVERLQSANTVVGRFERWECTMSETPVNDGDVLVLYTDGVVEAFDRTGEEFGESRLIDALYKNRNLSAHLLAQIIVDQVTSYSGTEQYDDITIVVAKRIT
jgi:serine phosphatase RsbU (regulator of sigma subunit)/catechol 2,3-dioxygenase-like lactoylglutathione lyase family enzyme